MVLCLLRGTNKGIRSLLEESLTISKEMLREAQLAYPRNPVRNHNYLLNVAVEERVVNTAVRFPSWTSTARFGLMLVCCVCDHGLSPTTATASELLTMFSTPKQILSTVKWSFCTCQ